MINLKITTERVITLQTLNERWSNVPSDRMPRAWGIPQQYAGHSILQHITNHFIWRFLSYNIHTKWDRIHVDLQKATQNTSIAYSDAMNAEKTKWQKIKEIQVVTNEILILYG